MRNPFKNNSLASGMLGFILGAGTWAGGQSIINNSSLYSYTQPSGILDNSFRGLDNNEDGDVVITPSGKCYHSIWGCRTLKRSNNCRKVTREQAEGAGLYPCSKCCP